MWPAARASSSASWCWKLPKPTALATVGNLWLATLSTLLFDAYLANAKEHAKEICGTGIWVRKNAERKAVESNCALCATRTSSRRKVSNSPAASAKVGASLTSSGVMPWMEMLTSSKCSMPAGGWHSHTLDSVSSPATKRTAPIWQIDAQLPFAVSTSTATKSKPGVEVAASSPAAGLLDSSVILPERTSLIHSAQPWASWLGAKVIVQGADLVSAKLMTIRPEAAAVGWTASTASISAKAISRRNSPVSEAVSCEGT